MYIYKITNTINNKIYIGKLVRNNPHYMGSGKILKLAYNKHGIENFKKEIIEYCSSKEELSEREKYWILFFNSTDKKIGYNITKGGDGGCTNNYFINKTLTVEHRRKISKNHHDVKGENNPMYNKNHTTDSKKKMSDFKLGKTHSDETRMKMSNSHMGENNHKSILTKKIVSEIRTDYELNNLKLKDLMKKYDLKKACLWKVVNYYTWNYSETLYL